MSTNVYTLILYFSLYSVLGWAMESTWVSIGTRKLTNRGFLTGPYCPIYGFGAVVILFTCVPLKAYPPLVFLVAMLAASVLEYFTGWLLETLFHAKWWDYSQRKFNIKGRVCLRNALLFGLLGVAITYFIDPEVEKLIGSLTYRAQQIIALAIVALLLLDLAHAVATLLGLRKRIAALHETVEDLAAINAQEKWFDPKDLRGSIERLRALCLLEKDNPKAQDMLEKLDALTAYHATMSRMFHAFPNMVHKDFQAEIKQLRQKWRDDLDEIKNRKA